MKIKAPFIALLTCGLIFTGFYLADQFDQDIAANDTALTLTELDLTRVKKNSNSPIKLQDTLGKHLIVHFWASWCGVCKSERPVMKKIWNKLKDSSNVQFLTVATNDTMKDLKQTITFTENILPVAFDVDEKLSEFLNLDSVPTTVVFNEKGELLHSFDGRLQLNEIEKLISFK